MHPRRHLAAARLRHHAYAGDREAGVASIQIVVLMNMSRNSTGISTLTVTGHAEVQVNRAVDGVAQ